MHATTLVSLSETRGRSVSLPPRLAHVPFRPTLGSVASTHRTRPHAPDRAVIPGQTDRRGPSECLVRARPGAAKRSFTRTSSRPTSWTKSNIVPVPGLEPGRPSFKGWWAANYPTPDQHTVCYEIAIAATVNPQYRPGRRGGISRSPVSTARPRLLGWRTTPRHARGCPAFDPVVKVCAAADVDAEAAVIVLAHVLPYGLRVVRFSVGVRN